MTWQSMETAPKDGGRLILYWPYWCSYAVIGCWSRSQGRWICEVSMAGEGQDPPVAWMPLPAPPEVPR